MRIEVVNTIKAYEEDGKEVKGFDYPKIVVRSHWNNKYLVVLCLPDGKTYTVGADNLKTAIGNAVTCCT